MFPLRLGIVIFLLGYIIETTVGPLAVEVSLIANVNLPPFENISTPLFLPLAVDRLAKNISEDDLPENPFRLDGPISAIEMTASGTATGSNVHSNQLISKI
ncbi:hypothetical protein HY024_00465 [Candidatus Curtissbacteria bacterium]|nr:hypothetical protein [Candidatus Curtissbacteria bacterium]